MGDTTIQPVPVRDIYRLEFDLFKNMYWVWFYMGAISVFATHMCLGWQKVVGAPSMDIPKRFQSKATHIGYILTLFICLVYISFPIYTHCAGMKVGNLGSS